MNTENSEGIGNVPTGVPWWYERVPIATWRAWICRGGAWDVSRSAETGRLRWAPVRGGTYVAGLGLLSPRDARTTPSVDIAAVQEQSFTDVVGIAHREIDAYAQREAVARRDMLRALLDRCEVPCTDDDLAVGDADLVEAAAARVVEARRTWRTEAWDRAYFNALGSIRSVVDLPYVEGQTWRESLDHLLSAIRELRDQAARGRPVADAEDEQCNIDAAVHAERCKALADVCWVLGIREMPYSAGEYMALIRKFGESNAPDQVREQHYLRGLRVALDLFWPFNDAALRAGLNPSPMSSSAAFTALMTLRDRVNDKLARARVRADRAPAIRYALTDLLHELGLNCTRYEIPRHAETVAEAIGCCAHMVHEWAEERIAHARASGRLDGSYTTAQRILNGLGIKPSPSAADIEDHEARSKEEARRAIEAIEGYIHAQKPWFDHMPAWWRGHAIEERGGKWVYADTGTAVAEEPARPCGSCGLPNRTDGHDACLGELPGVMNACCGHGQVSDAYVQLVGGGSRNGIDALRFAFATQERNDREKEVQDLRCQLDDAYRTSDNLYDECMGYQRTDAERKADREVRARHYTDPEIATLRAWIARQSGKEPRPTPVDIDVTITPAREVRTAYNRDARQADVHAWCARAFGVEHATNLEQRAVRFLEEALELFQAAGGSEAMAMRLMFRVFRNPSGELAQELGGAGVTLLALASAARLSADAEERRETERVLAIPDEVWAQRHAAKRAEGLDVVEGEVRPERDRAAVYEAAMRCAAEIKEMKRVTGLDVPFDVWRDCDDAITAIRGCAPEQAAHQYCEEQEVGEINIGDVVKVESRATVRSFTVTRISDDFRAFAFEETSK